MRTVLAAVSLPLLSIVIGACAGAAPKPSAPSQQAYPGRAAAYETATAATADSDGVPEGARPTAAPAPMAPGAVSTSPMPSPTSTGGGAVMKLPPTEPAHVGVKAGEWDDNANYRDFQKWLSTEEATPFHRANVSMRRFLVVRDSHGQGIPRCKVTVSDSQQKQVTLTTTASGRTILFPIAEGLSGKELAASATCNNGTASAKFALDDSDGVVDLKVNAARVLPQQKTIDIAFILDTTGSMSEEITAVKATIQKVAASLQKENFGVRIGMVAFKDRGDEYVTRVYPMTTDVDGFRTQVQGVYAAGGGDTPEAVNEGVHAALTKLDWNGESVAKLAFLVGDAPPHLDYQQDADYAADMKDAAHRGIQIFTIAASGMDDLGQVVFRQIAQYTGATNMFVLRGGAGPQSTGGGDAKSGCGGTHTNFASGNLDGLILSKIHFELKSLTRDPMKIAGLKTDENAKPCNERLIARD